MYTEQINWPCLPLILLPEKYTGQIYGRLVLVEQINILVFSWYMPLKHSSNFRFEARYLLRLKFT